MCTVKIGPFISFASNYGVLVERRALELPAQYLQDLIRKAHEHEGDEVLVEACCASRGPLAGRLTIEFEEYLQVKEQYELANAGRKAKHELTAARRRHFQNSRAALALSLLDACIPYVCVTPGCAVCIDLTIDHKTPLSRGGTDDPANLQFMCRTHNSAKGDSIP